MFLCVKSRRQLLAVYIWNFDTISLFHTACNFVKNLHPKLLTEVTRPHQSLHMAMNLMDTHSVNFSSPTNRNDNAFATGVEPYLATATHAIESIRILVTVNVVLIEFEASQSQLHSHLCGCDVHSVSSTQ
ncbi:MAG: hypothetical protein CMJ31_09830 [Phycisphaerae bacterium]|nr:hypothetical protein [Phycisphaerae bacterium]